MPVAHTASLLLDGLGWPQTSLGLVDSTQQNGAAKISLASTAANQVRRAHLSMASLVPEVTARELFDDMLHRDNDAEQAAFDAPMVSAAFAHELFGERPLADVIWDDEFVPELNTFDQAVYVERAVPNPEEVVFMSPFCSEDAAYSVFNEVPFVDVSWDVMSTDPIVHEGLLQQLAQGLRRRCSASSIGGTNHV